MRRRARPRWIGSPTRSIDTLVAGVRSNVAFLGALCRAASFREGKVDTGFIDRNLAALGAVPHEPDRAAAALGVAHLLRWRAMPQTSRAGDTAEPYSPWAARDGFQLSGARRIDVPILIDGEGAEAAVTYGKDGISVVDRRRDAGRRCQGVRGGDDVYVLRHGRQTRVRVQGRSAASAASRRRRRRRQGADARQGAGAFRRRGRSGRRRSTSRRDRGDEDGTHAARAVCRHRGRSVAVAAGTQVVEGAQIMVIERSGSRVSCRHGAASHQALRRLRLVQDLEGWIKQRLKDKRKRGEKPEHIHRTRMVPKRADELIDGGSLYWVIRGEIACRQRIRDVRPFRDKDGIGRCGLVLEPKVVLVEPRPFRAFQGWRYLAAKDAPRDLDKAAPGRGSDAREAAAGAARTRPDVSPGGGRRAPPHSADQADHVQSAPIDSRRRQGAELER